MTTGVPRCRFGNMPNDEQELIVDADERERIRASDPTAAAYLRELIGADEMLNGVHRYCLWLVDANPADIRSSAILRARVAAVRNYRSNSSRAATRALAATPALFGEIRQPQSAYLCLPRHTSFRREYIPMAYFAAENIAHDSTLTIEAAPLSLFGVLNSEMFMTWVRTVAGRLKSDFRLSTELVYNTFPWPTATPEKAQEVADLAQAVLDARMGHTGATLADLYDPTSMPPDLARAHVALSRAVGRLYGRKRMTTELERQAVLFDRYAELIRDHLAAQPTDPTKSGRKRR